MPDSKPDSKSVFASTSGRENKRLTGLAGQNLHRFLSGRPLHNMLQPERYY